MSNIQLGKIQRMACLAITGAMKSTPTVAMEVLLNLTPLNLMIMAEVRMALYRMYMSTQPVDLRTETGLLSIWKNVSDPILDMRSITPFQFTTSLKSSMSLLTRIIGVTKTQSSLRMH
jgi:hypothetical protein